MCVPISCVRDADFAAQIEQVVLHAEQDGTDAVRAILGQQEASQELSSSISPMVSMRRQSLFTRDPSPSPVVPPSPVRVTIFEGGCPCLCLEWYRCPAAIIARRRGIRFCRCGLPPARKPRAEWRILAPQAGARLRSRLMSATPRVMVNNLSGEENQSVRRLFDKGVVIPPQPRVLHKLQDQLAKGVADVRVLARTIGQDPGIAAMLFKIVQSAVYQPYQPFSSLEDILQAVGLKQTGNLVTAIALTQSLPAKHNRKAFESYWARSKAVSRVGDADRRGAGGGVQHLSRSGLPGRIVPRLRRARADAALHDLLQDDEPRRTGALGRSEGAQEGLRASTPTIA